MAAEVMLALGEFQFSVETAAYQEFTRTTAYKWASQDRFGNGPALQFVGLDDETISLSGVIFPEFRGGLVQMDNLRALAVQGRPQELINGQGYLLGQWVVLSVDEKQSEFLPGGVPQKIEFTLQLKRYDNEMEQNTTESSQYAGPTGTGAYEPEPTPTQPWAASNYGTDQLPMQAPNLADVNIYIARAGDTLSNIAASYYGRVSGRVVERLLEKNPALGNVGAVLPGGLPLTLPPLPNLANVMQSVKLWS